MFIILAQDGPSQAGKPATIQQGTLANSGGLPTGGQNFADLVAAKAPVVRTGQETGFILGRAANNTEGDGAEGVLLDGEVDSPETPTMALPEPLPDPASADIDPEASWGEGFAVLDEPIVQVAATVPNATLVPADTVAEGRFPGLPSLDRLRSASVFPAARAETGVSAAPTNPTAEAKPALSYPPAKHMIVVDAAAVLPPSSARVAAVYASLSSVSSGASTVAAFPAPDSVTAAKPAATTFAPDAEARVSSPATQWAADAYVRSSAGSIARPQAAIAAAETSSTASASSVSATLAQAPAPFVQKPAEVLQATPGLVVARPQTAAEPSVRTSPNRAILPTYGANETFPTTFDGGVTTLPAPPRSSQEGALTPIVPQNGALSGQVAVLAPKAMIDPSGPRTLSADPMETVSSDTADTAPVAVSSGASTPVGASVSPPTVAQVTIQRALLANAVQDETDRLNLELGAGSTEGVFASHELGPSGARTIAANGAAASAPMAQNAAMQIAQATANSGGASTELVLDPEELGKVRMKMVSDEQSITLYVAAERPETLDLLRRNIEVLEQEFRDLGFSDVTFAFGDGAPPERQANSSDHTDGPMERGFGEVSRDPVETATRRGPDGHLDIRL